MQPPLICGFSVVPCHLQMGPLHTLHLLGSASHWSHGSICGDVRCPSLMTRNQAFPKQHQPSNSPLLHETNLHQQSVSIYNLANIKHTKIHKSTINHIWHNSLSTSFAPKIHSKKNVILAKFRYWITSYIASSFGIWGRNEPSAYHPSWSSRSPSPFGSDLRPGKLWPVSKPAIRTLGHFGEPRVEVSVLKYKCLRLEFDLQAVH